MLKDKMPNLEFRDEDETFLLTVNKNGTDIKIRLDIRIFPGDQAKSNPVGGDRSEPNMLPYLPPPVGRIQLSLNPFTMLGQLVSPEFLAKFTSIVCIILCCMLFLMCIPMMFSNAVTILGLKMLGFSWTSHIGQEILRFRRKLTENQDLLNDIV